MPDRATTALMTWAARSSGRTDANAPPCRPTGVLRAVMIAARLCIRLIALDSLAAGAGAEFDSLSEWKFARKVDRVGLATHVLLPAIAPTLAAATGIFLAAEDRKSVV